MKKREIIRTLLAKQIPERVGIFEQFWPFICENAWAEQGVPADTDFVARFNLDIQQASWNTVPGPRPDLVKTMEETEEWILSRDAWGAQFRLWKKKSGTPEHVDFAVASPEIWKRDFREAVIALDMHQAFDLEKVKADYRRDMAGEEFVTFATVLVFEDLRRILGDVVMLESLLLEPEWIHDFNQVMSDKYIEGFEILFNEVGKPDGMHLFDDLGYTQAPFASPDCHRELILPYHKKIVRYLKDHGLPVILHTCGDFRPHLPAIIEAGFDCIQPLEARAGCDVRELKPLYGDQITFFGNIDNDVLARGDRAEIREEVTSKVLAAKPGGGYIWHSDHSVPPTVSFASYRYAVELAKEYGQY